MLIISAGITYIHPKIKFQVFFFVFLKFPKTHEFSMGIKIRSKWGKLVSF